MSTSLPTVDDAALGLGLPTILDRELAAALGVPYVHLVVLAIDIDRVRPTVEGEEELPLGWDVFVLTRSLMRALPEMDLATAPLLTALTHSLLAQLDDETRLGMPLLFALRELSRRHPLGEPLEPLFRAWAAPQPALRRCLSMLFQRPQQWERRLAAGCLAAPLTPPMAPPSRLRLQQLVDPTHRSDACTPS